MLHAGLRPWIPVPEIEYVAEQVPVPEYVLAKQNSDPARTGKKREDG